MKEAVAVFLDIASQTSFVPNYLVQFHSWNVKYLHLTFRLSELLQLRHRLFQYQDAGEDIRVLEDRCVAEINNALQRSLFREEGAQGLTIADAHPLIGDNIGHSATYTKQAQPLLVEVDVEIGDAMIGLLVRRGKIGFELAQFFLAHIGRVPDHHIEARRCAFQLSMTIKEDFRKLQFPVEEAISSGARGSSLEPGIELRRRYAHPARRIIGERLPERRIYREAEMRCAHQVRQHAILLCQLLT